MYTEQITQRLAIGAGLDPQTVNNATVNSGSVDMQKSRRAFFILNIGTVTAGGSINAKLQESSDNSTWSDLSGNNVSQTGLTTSNQKYTFEVRAGQLTKRYVRLQVTNTAAFNVVLGVVGFGDDGIHKPNNANNDASVATQNVVS